MYKKAVVAALLGGLLAGCANDPNQSYQRTGTGAVIGAIAGGVIGHQVDHKSGAVVGAVLGGAAGAAIGHAMDQQEQEFNRALATEQQQREVEVERVRDDLLKLTLDSEVSFDFDKATIRPSFRRTLDKLAQVLNKYQRSYVTVVGHTDSKGSESYNQQLSEDRARAVADYLATRGVEQWRLRTEGRGESEPRASNATEAGRQLNRRVEIFVQPEEAVQGSSSGGRSEDRYNDRYDDRYDDRSQDRYYDDRR